MRAGIVRGSVAASRLQLAHLSLTICLHPNSRADAEPIAHCAVQAESFGTVFHAHGIPFAGIPSIVGQQALASEEIGTAVAVEIKLG